MNEPTAHRERALPSFDDRANNHKPIFQAVFGETWEKLPAVMRMHYANRPYSDDRVTVKGNLDVLCRGPIRALQPLLRLLGLIPPYNETHVPVTVVYESHPDSRDFSLNRTFHFANREPYRFNSRMRQVSGAEVVELMRFGIGWRMRYLWQDGKVILQHKGYLLNLFGRFIPLPLTALLGTVYAEETALDDSIFDMCVEIRHPWWGKIYGYSGRFEISGET